MKQNPYQKHIVKLLIRKNDLLSFSDRVRMEINQSVKNFNAREGDDNPVHFSGVFIRDWSSENESERSIRPTIIDKKVMRSEYQKEAQMILELQWNLSFAQLCEALESLMKDCMITFDSSRKRSDLKRDEIKKNFKADGGNLLKSYSESIAFFDILKVFTDARDCITHASSRIDKGKLGSQLQKEMILNLFDYDDLGNGFYALKLNKHSHSRGLQDIANFGFQIFKIYSINGNHEWKNIFFESNE